MTEFDLLLLAFSFVTCLLFLSHGRARYWQGKFEESNELGWMDEALFWRHHFDKESAIWVDSDGKKEEGVETF